MVCYESRKLKEHERHYTNHNLKLATIVHALNMWRHYLMGKIFELSRDHSGLQYLFGHPTLNARQIIWLEFLNEYEFDIKNIKGKKNKVVDALNKRVHERHSIAISMYRFYWKENNFRGFKIKSNLCGKNEKFQQGDLQ
jgi:hypothetical protein